MTRAIFGQSYFLRFDPKLWKAMQPYPPLGSLIAANCARQLGCEIEFFDSMLAPSVDAWKEAVERSRPRFAILYEDNFNYLSKMCLLRMREAGIEMAKVAKSCGATVIVCGADATDHPDLYLAGGADFVLIGEGEDTLVELLPKLIGSSDVHLESIAGLAFPSSPGRPIIRTPPRAVIRNLDRLPEPAWDLVDLAHYRQVWRKHHGYFSLNLATTRGCPYHCNWCAKPIWGQTYHVRDPESVAQEMSDLKECFQVEHIWFADDIMGLKPGWLARFAEALHKSDVGLPFKCLSRADLILRDGEVEALRRAGAKTVWIGAESGSQHILDAMDKGITVEQIYRASQTLRAAGIEVGFFLQFGYPGEGLQEIEQTLKMVRECRPDEIGMSVSYPLPGTRFYASVPKELSQKRNWVDSEDLEILYQGPFGTEFYRCLYEVLNGEFALWRHTTRIRQRKLPDWRLADLRDLSAWSYRRLKLPWDRRRLRDLA